MAREFAVQLCEVFEWGVTANGGCCTIWAIVPSKGSAVAARFLDGETATLPASDHTGWYQRKLLSQQISTIASSLRIHKASDRTRTEVSYENKHADA
jgi:hypothetical protein